MLVMGLFSSEANSYILVKSYYVVIIPPVMLSSVYIYCYDLIFDIGNNGSEIP